MRKTSILLALVIFISVNIFFGGCSNDKNNSTQENREITSNISNVVGYSEDSFNIENDYQTFSVTITQSLPAMRVIIILWGSLFTF